MSTLLNDFSPTFSKNWWNMTFSPTFVGENEISHTQSGCKFRGCFCWCCAFKSRLCGTNSDFMRRHVGRQFGQLGTAISVKSGKVDKHHNSLGYCVLCTLPPDAPLMRTQHIKEHLSASLGKVFQNMGLWLGSIFATQNVSTSSHFKRHETRHFGQKATFVKSGKVDKHRNSLGYCSLYTWPPDAPLMRTSHINTKTGCTRNPSRIWTFVKIPFLSGFPFKWRNREYFCSFNHASFTQNRPNLRSNISCEFLQLWRKRAPTYRSGHGWHTK